MKAFKMSTNPLDAYKLRQGCKRIHRYETAVWKLGGTSGALGKISAEQTPFRNSLICFKYIFRTKQVTSSRRLDCLSYQVYLNYTV